MSTKESMTLTEALENLNSLVDAGSLSEVELSEEHTLLLHPKEEGGYWVSPTTDEMVEIVRRSLGVVHTHLQHFYKKMKGGGGKNHLFEGVKTIMVLVGEAAKKLEKFGRIFKERISESPEYLELQNFYKNHIIRDSFKEFQEKGELTDLVAPEEGVEEVSGVHLLNEIEVVKADHLYELFYLKNEMGHRFYTQDLARNIKLACDFGQYAQEYFGDDPLLQMKNWEDKSLHLFAKGILDSSWEAITRFMKRAGHYRDLDVVESLNKALMALMLAANPKNLIRQFSLKGCYLYFNDFQHYLRQALNSRFAQHLFHETSSDPFFLDVLHLMGALCTDLFSLGVKQEELKSATCEMIGRHLPKTSSRLSKALEEGYQALTEELQHHPNGPLFKAVDLIREENVAPFDPLMMGNLPQREGVLRLGREEILCLRTPSPTIQEYVHQATLVDEFKLYLVTLSQKRQKEFCLFINLQDRTSWREHARSATLEEGARKADLADVFMVVTLAKDSDFYDQKGTYLELSEASEFLEHFYDHLKEENTGYFFPKEIKERLFPDFIQSLLQAVHQGFFYGKKELLLVERLNFIELTYTLIALKFIEQVEPTRLSFVSKDSLDSEGTAIVELLALLGIVQGKKWTAGEIQECYSLLFGPTLLYRERPVHKERMERAIRMIEVLEKADDLKALLSPLFKDKTLTAPYTFS